MNVTNTPIACTLPSDGEPGCACAPGPAPRPAPRTARNTAAKAAVIAAGTAAACTACCVLPFTLPAVIVANVGGVLTVLDRAHGWVTWLGIAAVAGAWLWIAGQYRRTRARPAFSTLAMMSIATLVITLSASWPLLKPSVFQMLSIAKKTSA